jgi:hypothetical protein
VGKRLTRCQPLDARRPILSTTARPAILLGLASLWGAGEWLGKKFR